MDQSADNVSADGYTKIIRREGMQRECIRLTKDMVVCGSQSVVLIISSLLFHSPSQTSTKGPTIKVGLGKLAWNSYTLKSCYMYFSSYFFILQVPIFVSNNSLMKHLFYSQFTALLTLWFFLVLLVMNYLVFLYF